MDLGPPGIGIVLIIGLGFFVLSFADLSGDGTRSATETASVKWSHTFAHDHTRVYAVQVQGDASWIGVSVETKDGVGIPYRHEGPDEWIDLGEGLQLFGSASAHRNATLTLSDQTYRLS